MSNRDVIKIKKLSHTKGKTFRPLIQQGTLYYFAKQKCYNSGLLFQNFVVWFGLVSNLAMNIFQDLSRKSESRNDHERKVEEKIKQQTNKNAYF